MINFFLGKLTGLGRYINEEGTCFEGIFDNNNIVSKATVITINKQNKRVEYFGDVLDFKKNGKGEEICKDEYKYVGDFSNDMKHGFGKLEFFESGQFSNKPMQIYRTATRFHHTVCSEFRYTFGKPFPLQNLMLKP